jgi:hypothetical protein
MFSGPRAWAWPDMAGQTIAAAAKIVSAEPRSLVRPTGAVIEVKSAPMGVISPEKWVGIDSAADFAANQGHRPSTP